jgi:predicted nucleic acid-binding protein
LPEIFCNTSPLQYLHQIGQLDLLPRLVQRIAIPTAVADELAAGRRLGLDLPVPETLSWIDIHRPRSDAAVLRLAADLGYGETAVIALALESTNAVLILDDDLARRHAEVLGLRLTGTLGVLLDAKRAGLVADVKPLINELQALGFRLSGRTREGVLRLAGEA